jgi:hypothetical protein
MLGGFADSNFDTNLAKNLLKVNVAESLRQDIDRSDHFAHSQSSIFHLDNHALELENHGEETFLSENGRKLTSMNASLPLETP